MINIPTLRILSDADIARIHSTSVDILSNFGIVIEDETALTTLEQSGALVDSGKRLAKIPSDTLDHCLKKLPMSRTLAGRSKGNDLKIEPGRTYARCPSGLVRVIDSQSRQCREGTTQDVKTVTRAQDALENIGLCGNSPYPSDVPIEIRDICQMKTILENTEKHIRFAPLSGNSLPYIVKLAAAVVGGEWELRRRPIVSCIVSPSSPLRYSREQIGAMALCGRLGVPVMLASTPIVGATGPVTLAGSLVLQNAEILGGIVLCQVLNPGAPVAYGPRIPVMDMRTGLSAWGAVESGLAAAAAAQMGQLYEVETDVHGPATDAKVLDEQAAIERVDSAILPGLAGASIINGAGMLESNLSVSIEQLVIDDELFGMMFRMLRGIEINETTMAKDIIGRVGPGGNFLIEKHTKEHYRAEHFLPQLFDRTTRDIWEKAGSKDVVKVSKENANRLLREHEVPALDSGIAREMQAVLEDAKKSAGSLLTTSSI